MKTIEDTCVCRGRTCPSRFCDHWSQNNITANAVIRSQATERDGQVRPLQMLLTLLFLLLSTLAFSLTLTAPFPNPITLPDLHINPQTLTITADSLLLTPDTDYTYATHITLTHPEYYETITIEYQTFPEHLFKVFSLYQPIDLADSTKVEAITTNWDRIFAENSKLNITGNKIIAVSVSNQGGFDLNQSLFLRIDGELASNVFIKAQLNDSQSPITPEGNTRELSSLDEVYIAVYGKEYEVALGDLKMEIAGTKFINTTQKFEGLKVSYFDKRSTNSLGIALSNSKTGYNTFSGVEGKQGPYFLRPGGVHSTVQVVAGSETIWLNGSQLRRGQDYQIDYNEGSVDFYAKHFISANSRIQASFQYTDEYYRKNSAFGNTSIDITQHLRATASMIYQNDDKESSVTSALTDEDKEVLTNTAVGPYYVNGAMYVGPGEGSYIFTNDHYEYAPGSLDADYNVTFTYFGEGNGDYNQISMSHFEYVGTGQGGWLPLREVKAPERKANYDLSLQYKRDSFTLYSEHLFSEYNQNTFANHNTEDNYSQIHHLQFSLHPNFDAIKPELEAWYRFRQRGLYTFATIINESEAYQQYSFASIDTLDANEYNISLKTVTYGTFTQETQVRMLDYESRLKQRYINAFQKLEQTKYLPYLDYRYHYSENHIASEKQKITINEPTIKYTLGNAVWKGNALFQQNLIYERDMQKYTAGTRYNKYYTEATLAKLLQSTLFASYQSDENMAYIADEGGIWQRERTSDTYTLQTETRLKNHQFTTLYSHRIVEPFHSDESKQTYDLAELRTKNSVLNEAILFSGSYNLKNTEFFLRLRELVWVGPDMGIYDEYGEIDENGEYDYEYELATSDPIRSLEVNTNLDASVYPANLLQKESNLKEFLQKINLETNISVSEQTTNSEQWKVYLLMPNAIFNQQSLYSKQEIRQAVWYNLVPSKLITRYSYLVNNSLDNRYNQFAEHTITENEATIRLLRIGNSDLENYYKWRTEYDSQYLLKSQSQMVGLNIRTTSSNQLIFTTEFGLESETNTSGDVQFEQYRYSLSENVLYYIGQKYRINTTFTLKYNDIKDKVYISLPPDKVAGAFYNWQTGLEHRINKISTLNMLYSGYKNPIDEVFHQAKMEIRLEF